LSESNRHNVTNTTHSHIHTHNGTMPLQLLCAHALHSRGAQEPLYQLPTCGERLCKNITKHVFWTWRMLWIVADGRSW